VLLQPEHSRTIEMMLFLRREKSMQLVFRRLLLLSTPIALGLLETLHPVIRDARTAYQVLEHQVGWWIALQLLQIVLSCLLALLVWRLLKGSHGPAVTFSRIGLAIFLLCSLAYERVIGIGTGLLVAHANALALAVRACLVSQSSVVEAIAACYGSPIGTGLVVLGGLAWVWAALAALRTLSTQSDLKMAVSGALPQ
jgi:hypothetical protein